MLQGVSYPSSIRYSRFHLIGNNNNVLYRDRLKGMQILLSNSQAGPGRKVKQEQEEISRNHVQAFIQGSVDEVMETIPLTLT